MVSCDERDAAGERKGVRFLDERRRRGIRRRMDVLRSGPWSLSPLSLPPPPPSVFFFKGRFGLVIPKNKNIANNMKILLYLMYFFL